MVGMTRVKICGITRLEDAELAVEVGAWALGLILWHGSPRAASRRRRGDRAPRCAAAPSCVGVFVNPTLDEVAARGRACRPHATSSCTATRARASAPRSRGAPAASVIKAARIGGRGRRRAALERFHTDFHLLDARPAARRHGQTWDWGLARRSARTRRSR